MRTATTCQSLVQRVASSVACVTDLGTEIRRKVGKALDIWWDHYNIAGNTRVTPEIIAAAGDCASIVVVASPVYLKSDWCDRERSMFFQLLGRRQSDPSRAVFIVSIEPIEQQGLPADLRDFGDMSSSGFWMTAAQHGRCARNSHRIKRFTTIGSLSWSRTFRTI